MAVISQKPFGSPLMMLPASLMPKMPAIAAIPASTTVTAVSLFMTSERLLLICERYTSSVVLTRSRYESSSSVSRIRWS